MKKLLSVKSCTDTCRVYSWQSIQRRGHDNESSRTADSLFSVVRTTDRQCYNSRSLSAARLCRRIPRWSYPVTHKSDLHASTYETPKVWWRNTAAMKEAARTREHEQRPWSWKMSLFQEILKRGWLKIALIIESCCFSRVIQPANVRSPVAPSQGFSFYPHDS